MLLYFMASSVQKKKVVELGLVFGLVFGLVLSWFVCASKQVRNYAKHAMSMLCENQHLWEGSSIRHGLSVELFRALFVGGS